MSPRQAGWRPAPAWRRPNRFWLVWPARDRGALARDDCIGLAELLSDYAAVSVLAHSEDVAECALRTPPGVSAVAHPHGGRPAGARAPLWLLDDANRVAGAVAGDDAMARVMAETAGAPLVAAPPGLADCRLDCDGEGWALAMAPAAHRAGLEPLLADWLGLERIVWLDPDGESMPARFIAPGLVAASPRALEAVRGSGLAVVELPCPKRAGCCYADAVVAGDLVVMPAFEDRADDEAFARLGDHLPAGRVISWPATCLGAGGLGAVVAVTPG